MGFVAGIQANVAVGRLAQSFAEIRTSHSGQPDLIYWGLFYTLKPFKPFSNFTSDAIGAMVQSLLELNDTDQGFKFLCLLAHNVIKNKIRDVDTINGAIAAYVSEKKSTPST